MVRLIRFLGILLMVSALSGLAAENQLPVEEETVDGVVEPETFDPPDRQISPEDDEIPPNRPYQGETRWNGFADDVGTFGATFSISFD